MKSLVTLSETIGLIESGSRLLISGDESLLAKLPKGDWIGGTIPYFMSEVGGVMSKEKLHVTLLPPSVTKMTIKEYSVSELSRLPDDYMPNGVSFIIIPAFSGVHQTFAEECSTWKGIFERPLIGWVSGTDLSSTGMTPKVFNGLTGEMSSTKAIVLHADLELKKYAKVNIINLFNQGSGDVITFENTSFEIGLCKVNGQVRNFAEYLLENKIDTQLPLVASYLGTKVNVSIKEVNPFLGKVSLYAPTFENIEYRFASSIGDYEENFLQSIKDIKEIPVFTCNCILNYLYAKLEGKKTGGFIGPITFGEIAYMLLNQTFVYITFEDRG